jgi:hypothetical protein
LYLRCKRWIATQHIIEIVKRSIEISEVCS